MTMTATTTTTTTATIFVDIDGCCKRVMSYDDSNNKYDGEETIARVSMMKPNRIILLDNDPSSSNTTTSFSAASVSSASVSSSSSASSSSTSCRRRRRSRRRSSRRRRKSSQPSTAATPPQPTTSSNIATTTAAAEAATPSSTATIKNNKNKNMYAHVKSIMFMAGASAVHLGGFEIARGASFALFTSSRTGFAASPAASPLSTVCMAPFSLGLFWLYTKCLDRYGPHKSIFLSTVTFAVLLAFCGWVLYLIDPHLSVEVENDDAGMSSYHTDRYNDDQYDYYNVSSSMGSCRGNINDGDGDYDDFCYFSEKLPRRVQYHFVWKKLAQSTTFFLHVASSAFFQLLYTQHWSFLGSVIGMLGVNDGDDSSNNDRKSQKLPSSSEGTMWFAPIAGLGSVSSTVAGICLPRLVERFGLTGSLSVAAGVLLLSGVLADRAYRIALQNGFEPGHFHNHKTKACHGGKEKNTDDNGQHDSLTQASVKLFRRVPVLGSLSLEVLACQSVSSIIHFLFVLEVQQSIPDDTHRANWTAHCYAWMNACSGVLQFLVLPLLMRHWNPTKKQDGVEPSKTRRWQQRFLWLTMPILMMVCSALLVYYNNEKALSLVTLAFALNKVLEWSVRGVAMETLYSSLDYESQFLGKELISMVVDRVGRSSTAVALSFVTSMFGLSPALDKGFVHALSVSSLLWFMTSYPLSKHLPSYQNEEKGRT